MNRKCNKDNFVWFCQTHVMGLQFALRIFKSYYKSTVVNPKFVSWKMWECKTPGCYSLTHCLLEVFTKANSHVKRSSFSQLPSKLVFLCLHLCPAGSHRCLPLSRRSITTCPPRSDFNPLKRWTDVWEQEQRGERKRSVVFESKSSEQGRQKKTEEWKLLIFGLKERETGSEVENDR